MTYDDITPKGVESGVRLVMALVATRSYLKQCVSMRKILTLCLAGTLLTGCESDFDSS